MTREDLIQLSSRIQMDLSNAQAKLVELRAWIAQLPIPDEADPHVCECGVKFRGPRKLAEHRYLQHDGPEPEHWKQAKANTEEAA